MQKSLKPRDKIEVTVAAGILVVYIGAFEVTDIGGDATLLMRLLVVTATVTMFGDNVQKAREVLASKRDNHGENDG